MARNNPVLLTGPTRGLDGRSVLAKARAPLITDGRIGDFWIDTVSKKLYGPKNAAEWPDNGLIKGDKGWTPVFATVTDGTRRVQQIVDWTGGEGTKPAVGKYVGAAGLVDNIEDAADFRGPGGPQALINALDPKADAVTYETLTALGEDDTDNEKGEIKRLFEPGGSLPFATVADAQTEAIPAVIKSVEIHAPRRTYKRAASEPAERKFRSADRWTPDGDHDSSNGGWWAEDTSLFGTTIDMSGGFAGAPPLSVPQHARRRYIDVGAYAPLNDTLDAHAAIQAALNDGAGREIVFTPPIGGTRYYRSLSRSSGRLILPVSGRLIFEKGAILDFSNWGVSGAAQPFLSADAPNITSSSVNGVATAGDRTITMAVGQGAHYRAGNWYYLNSDDLFTTNDAGLGTLGEWVFVVGVSGDVLGLASKIRATYSTNVKLVRADKLCELDITGAKIVGTGQFSGAVGDRGIRINFGVNCHVRDCDIWDSDGSAIQFNSVNGGSIKNNQIKFGYRSENSINSYGVSIADACENLIVEGNDVQGGKEQIVLTNSGGVTGVTRNISITKNTCKGARRSGICTHDSHDTITIEGNTIELPEIGIDCRIANAIIRSNTIRKTGSFNGTINAAVNLGSGAGRLVIEGNVMEDCLRNVYLSNSIVHEVPPGDIDVIDNDMRNVGTHGVFLRNTTGSTDECGTVTVEGNRMTGGGAAFRGVELEGKWRPIITDNYMTGGGGNRSIALHATNNGGGTQGAINPVIIDNEWDNSMLDPSVLHFSGRLSVHRNVQIDATALPSLASGSNLTLPVTGEDIEITGNGTIATILQAAAYVGRVVTFHCVDAPTFTHNGGGGANTLQLAGGVNFVGSANDTLTLVSTGVVWREKSRAVI